MSEVKLIKLVWLNLLVNRRLLNKLIGETKSEIGLIQSLKVEAQKEVPLSISNNKTISQTEKNQSPD